MKLVCMIDLGTQEEALLGNGMTFTDMSGCCQISQGMLGAFREHLRREEKSGVTIGKYMQDVCDFMKFSGEKVVDKELVLQYKQRLVQQYAARSVNSKLASLRSFFRFLGWTNLTVKNVKLQQQVFSTEEQELTKAEYLRLLRAASGNTRLRLVLETICSTGIRVSELAYFTLEAVRSNAVAVKCKGKSRRVFIPGKLKNALLQYAKAQKIKTGPLFRTRSGKPLNRSNIWAEMKRLCKMANVSPSKVFPHNLRKLFARTFYSIAHDIAKLADILGHSNINTTRIYIMTSGSEHRRTIEQMGLIE